MKENVHLGYFLFMVLTLWGCSEEKTSDAYGQFEATETTISAEVPGKLIEYEVDEGELFKAGERVGTVDTTRLVLQRRELKSQLESVRAQISNVNAEVDVLRQELALAQANLERIKAMHIDKAATDQQLDDARTKVQTIKSRIEVQQTRKLSIQGEIEAVSAKIAQVSDQLQDAAVINPIEGTVLTSFVEPYEVVGQGQPLYRIANLDTMVLQVYVSGAQLSDLKLRQPVEVLIDRNAEEYKSLTGQVRWIASQAEFTPQQIQTKKERVSQVYAVEVSVPNPHGILKIGMPGEVNFINP